MGVFSKSLAVAAAGLLCASPAIATGSSAEATTSATAVGNAVASASASASSGWSKAKSESYAASYGHSKMWPKSDYGLTPYTVDKVYAYYPAYTPKCPAAVDYKGCDECNHCSDPWDWKFGYDWAEPTLKHKGDDCEVLEYPCEKVCTKGEHVCKPECAMTYEEVCTPYCTDVPYEHCVEEIHPVCEEHCAEAEHVCETYYDQECNTVCSGCEPEPPCSHCDSYGRKLLTYDSSAKAASEAEAKSGGSKASAAADASAYGQEAEASADTSAYAGEGKASSSASAYAKASSKKHYKAPECHPTCHDVCTPVEKKKCHLTEPVCSKVCTQVPQKKCSTKYKKECTKECKKVPKQHCVDKCHAGEDTCELLCVKPEEEPKHCYCSMH